MTRCGRGSERSYRSIGSFEVFQRQRAPLVKEPAVEIQKRGTISLNSFAYQELGEPEAVELLYDRDARLVALRKVEPTKQHAHLVRPNGANASSFLIAGTAFTQYYGPTEVARRWMARRTDDGMLVIDLNEESAVVVSNRNKRKLAPAAEF